MANFAFVIDPDPQRRRRYLMQAKGVVAPVDNLVVSGFDHDAAGAVWAASPSAPLSAWVNCERGAVIWGDAMGADSSKPFTASDLARHWDPGLAEVPTPLDGYYAGIAFNRGDALVAGADLLGLFPLYYAATRQVVIVSSSPELIGLHPVFPGVLSEEGLIGILLTDALVDNCTVWRGVHRLPPGHALVWRAGLGGRELVQYELPVSERHSTRSFGDHVEELDDALGHAVRRHTPRAEPHGIMLSGGRDSRLLAGYLEQQGSKPRALTMGGVGDHDVVCASRLSRLLKWEHRRVVADSSEFVHNAVLHATWDHLSSGFNSPHLWSMIDPLRGLAPSFTHGYIAGALAGGEGLTLRTLPGRYAPWELLFPKLNERGIEANTLKRILRSDTASELVDSAIDRIRAFYEQCCSLEGERVWRFQLASTSRLRVGSIPWRLSFGSWPVLPILDRRVLHAVATLPADSVANRRAQDEILRSRFPHLARVALVVRNVELERPLAPTRTHQVREQVGAAFKNVRLPRWRRAAPKRNYNWHLYDFDSPGWRGIRQRAEPNRNRLAELFDLRQLADYLPPPDAQVSWTFSETIGRKLMLGLLLWSETHLT